MGVVNNQLTIEQLRDACVESYAVYCEVMQDDGYFDKNVHKLLCNWAQKHVEAAEAKCELTGECMLQLALTMPRGSLKSSIVTKRLSEWIVIRRFYKFKDSTTRILLAGNTYTNAKKKLGGIRGTFSETMFKRLFPEMLPTASCKWSDEAACINRDKSFDESTFECGGTGTKLTGRHYNIIIEDDTTAPDIDEMKAEVTRPDRDTIERAVGFHKAAVPLFVPKGFRVSIIVSTRWAFFDLIAHVKAEEDYYWFDMPAKAPDGTPNFTSFYSEESLEIIKKRVGPYMFSMLYLNQPLDDSERNFKAEEFHYVDKKNIPKPESGSITIALDPAISEKDDACDSAITVNFVCQQIINGVKERHEYWLEDYSCKSLVFQLANKFLDIAEFWSKQGFKIQALIVETVAYQAALKQVIKNEMEKRGLSFTIIDFNSRTQKEIRIEGLQPGFAARRIHFLSRCVWGSRKVGVTDQTESQLVQYPDGRLVDVIDSWSMHRKVWKRDTNMKYREQRSEQEQRLALVNELLGRNSGGLLVEYGTQSGVAGLNTY